MSGTVSPVSDIFRAGYAPEALKRRAEHRTLDHPGSDRAAVSVRDSFIYHQALPWRRKQSPGGAQRTPGLVIVENLSDESSCLAADGAGASGVKVSGCGAD